MGPIISDGLRVCGLHLIMAVVGVGLIVCCVGWFILCGICRGDFRAMDQRKERQGIRHGESTISKKKDNI